jgi:hypothetical protein
MPRPRNPGGYPMIYAEIIELVASSGETIQHPCSDNKAAQHTRFMFYDYIKACRKSPQKREREIAQLAEGIMFSIRDNILVIKPRDMSEDAISLQMTLEKHKRKVTSSQPPAVSKKPSLKEAAQAIIPPPDPNAPDTEDLVNSYLKDRK